MNEPVTSPGANNRNPYSAPTATDWPALNRLYARTVKAIRAIDPDHIIFLEGDDYSRFFRGLDAPFSPNLAYSSHNYMAAGIGTGPYPTAELDKTRLAETFRSCEGYAFTREHKVPLWVGEFGAVFNGPPSEIPARLRALDDQIAVMEECGAHWTTWTYKDVGVMGWMTVAPDSKYMETIRPALDLKMKLHAEGWGWLPPSPMDAAVDQLNRVILEALGDPAVGRYVNHAHLTKTTLCTYVAGLLQTPYARCFKGMSESQIDEALSSWSFRKCRANKGQIAVLRKHFSRPARV
jgi:hypothetical protein